MVSKSQEIKPTWIEEIPKGWEVKQLGDLFDFSGGMPFSRSALGEEGFLYLHYGDIHKRNQTTFNTSNDFDWLPKIDIEMNKVKDNALLKTGDIIFADASEDYEGIGKSVVIENNENKIFISGLHTIIAKDQIELLDIGYKKYFLIPNFVRNQFIKIATGVTVFGISKANIKKIKVLVPPIPEQKEIAAILSSVDKAIEKTEAIIEKTEELKKGLMQRLLTKGVGRTKFKKTEIGEIPEEWNVSTVGELCFIKGGKRIPKGESFSEGKTPYPYIRVSNFADNSINMENLKYVSEEIYKKISRYTISSNDVYISIAGVYLGIVGTVPEELDNTLLTENAAKIVIKDNQVISKDYLVCVLESQSVKEQIRVFSGITGVPKLGLNKIQKLVIPVPPISEQLNVLDIVGGLNEKMKVERYNLKQLETLRKGLIQSLFTGKARVKVDEAEVKQV